ncbi:hypothetical protein D3C78_1365890 [compost metagenome]
MDRNRDDRRDRTDRQDGGEQPGNDDFRKGAQHFHHPAHHPAHEAGADEIGGGEEAEHEGKTRADDCRDQCNIEGDDQLVDEVGDVETIGDVNAVRDIVVFQRTIRIGRRQVEHRTEDFQRTIGHEGLHEIEEIGQALEELA